MDKYQWFKFSPASWMMGKILRQPETTQAAFIRLCCLYWNKNCFLEKFEGVEEVSQKHFSKLENSKIIEVKDGFIHINFLDEQYLGIQDDKIKKKHAADERWNKKRMQDDAHALQPQEIVMQNDAEKKRTEKIREEEREQIRIDKQNHKNDFVVAVAPKQKNIQNRKLEFGVRCSAFVTEYGKEIVRAFFNHWSESNPNGKKLRFEMEKTFEIKNRLDKWMVNDKKFNTGGGAPKTSNLEIIKEAGEIAEEILRAKYEQEENDLKA